MDDDPPSAPGPADSHWDTPRTSKAYQRVRAEVVKLGHTGEAWDTLAFSLGLLPTLASHGPALQRVSELLEAPVFQKASDWAAGTWVDQIQPWRAILADWPKVRAAFRGSDSFLDPRLSFEARANRRNPLRGRGMDVAPLASCLVVRHEFQTSSDPARKALAVQFDHLQAMFMAAAIDFRWASGVEVQAYLDWQPDGRHEFASHPIESHRACRALRWLSESPQAGILDGVGDATDPTVFMRQLFRWEAQVVPSEQVASASEPESLEEQRRRTYPSALTSYLAYWPEIRARRKIGFSNSPAPGGGGGGGGGATGPGVEGFIAPHPPAGDGKSQAQASQPSGPTGSTPDDPAGGLGGLSVDEVRPLQLPLVPAGEIDARLARQKWQAMRAAMSDTVTPFDLRNLSYADADRLARHLVGAARLALAEEAPDLQTLEDDLVALLVLALGQDPEIVSQVGLVFLESSPAEVEAARAPNWYQAPVVCLEQALQLPIDVPVLLVWRDVPPSDLPPWEEAERTVDADAEQRLAPSPWQAIAFLIPALQPLRASADTKDDAARGGQAEQTARNILIPAGVVGTLLADHFKRMHPSRVTGAEPWTKIESLLGNGRPSTASAETPARIISSYGLPAEPPPVTAVGPTPAAARVEALLNGDAGCAPPPGYDKWTVRLLKDLLAVYLEARSGDRTLAWMVTCNRAGETQARLYYTQHTLKKLAGAWQDAIAASGLVVLLDPESSTPERAEQPAPADAPAARPLGPQSLTAQPLGEGFATLLPERWPWADSSLDRLRAGSRFVATVDEVRRLLRTLQARVDEPIDVNRRSALREHHHRVLLLTLVVQGLCTAIRALRSPVALLRALEQADRVHAKAGLAPSEQIYAGLADKETRHNERARLVAIPELLVRQLRNFQDHQIALVTRLDRVTAWRGAPPRVRAMFRLDAQDNPTEVSVAWLEQQLAELGYPWPGNFARAFVRTRLLERGCAAADLDALLGHRDAGGGAIGLHSTLDMACSIDRIRHAQKALHAEIGLKFVQSALLPATDRSTGRGLPSSERDVLLAPLNRAGPVGRGRSGGLRQQQDVPELPPMWRQIHQKATDADRREVQRMFRLLQRSARRGNAFSAALCAEDPRAWAVEWAAANNHETEPAAQEEREATGPQASSPLEVALAEGASELTAKIKHFAEATTRVRFPLAASWFRLLARAQGLLKTMGLVVPALPMVDVVQPPASPFVEEAVLVLPIVDGWRESVTRWAEKALQQSRSWRSREATRLAQFPQEGPATASTSEARSMPLPEAPSVFSAEGWATALLMSACTHGMLLDRTQLSMLLHRFSTPGGRDLPVSGPELRAHLDFEVPASGSVDRQTHRWWLDPLSELIWLSAPPMPRVLKLGELHPWLRRITLEAFPGSVSEPYEPRSFGDLIRCSELWWLARSSRAVVASQRRQTDSSSVLTDRWSSLMSTQRLVAPSVALPTPAQAGPHDVGETGAAVIGASVSRGRIAPLPSDSPWSQLALVRFSGSRAATEDETDTALAADRDLLASLDAAHPWISHVSELLARVAKEPTALDVDDLRRACPSASSPASQTLIDFAVWLADPTRGAFTGPTLVRSFTAAAQALAVNGFLGPSAETLQAEQIARIIREVDDHPLDAGASLRSVQQALLRLSRFLGTEEQVLSLLEQDDREGLAAADQGTHADAVVISHEEYDDVQHALATGLNSNLTAGFRALAQLLLALCFRFGLRPGEAYGLRLKDVTTDYVYVLPYGSHQLKSENARRRVPLVLMPEAERQRLVKFVQKRVTRGASGDELLLVQPVSGPADRQSLDRWVHQIMREVTKNPSARLYHARHSLCTWTDLALRATDHPELLRFFSHLPKTSAFLKAGEDLGVTLFGSLKASLGRSSYALARLVGHVGPAISHMHYIHGDDLVRAAVVEREAKKIDKMVWMRLTGLARSTTFALTSAPGLSALIDNVRRSTGWKSRLVVTAGENQLRRTASGPTSGKTDPQSDTGRSAREHSSTPAAVAATPPGEPAGWIPISRIFDISQAIASKGRSRESVAALHGLDTDRLDTLMAGLKRWLPSVAQPGKQATNDAASGLISIALSRETAQYIQRAETAARARALVDPDGLKSDLEFLIACYDRRDRDFHVKEAASMKRLTALLTSFQLEPKLTDLVLRAANPKEPPPERPPGASITALGAFVSCTVRYVGVRSLAKASSYERWAGLMPVTAAGEGCGSAYAVFAAAVLAALE
ncbi:MAG: tyrosine-type recombinase/integrase [Polyangiaceae bacterium]|nr:tyrosine-type recombinase/integrase [Polyangiaceae bacterium]